MHREYHQWHSPRLHRKMELLVYGHGGKPVLVFPSSGGRFFDYENQGMVKACAPYLESGRLTLISVDAVDNEAWLNETAHPRQRGPVADIYDQYIIHEVVPFVRQRAGWGGAMGTTGCSMGAYQGSNLLFRHPDVFDWHIGLSGVYSLEFAVGSYMDDYVYYHSPIHYLGNLHDAWFLEHLRRARLIFCTGQGAWEELSVADQRRLEGVLASKGIPARFDYWGHDVAHDWPWWRRQMPYFLNDMV